MQVEVPGRKAAAKLRGPPGNTRKSSVCGGSGGSAEDQAGSGFGEVIDREGANLPSLLLLVLMSSAPALPLSEAHAPAVSALDDLWGERKLISDQSRLSSETVSLTYTMVDLIRSVID